jgi:hypothetical protein
MSFERQWQKTGNTSVKFCLKKGKGEKGSKYFMMTKAFGFCEIFILWRCNRKLTKAFDIYEIFILWRWSLSLTKAFDIYEIFILWRWNRKLTKAFDIE